MSNQQHPFKQVHNTLTGEPQQSHANHNSMSLLKKSQHPGSINNKERATTMAQKRQAANRCDFSQLNTQPPDNIDMKHHEPSSSSSSESCSSSSSSPSPSSTSISTSLTSGSNLSGVSNLNGANTSRRPATGSTKKAQKPRRRVATVAQRRAANIRERRRMFNLNSAFDRLRKKVPSFAYEKRLSRIETLKLAIMYIRFMDNLVNDDAYAEKYKQLTANLSQQQHPTCPLSNNLLSSAGSYLSNNGVLYAGVGAHCMQANLVAGECKSNEISSSSTPHHQPSSTNNNILHSSPQHCSTPHSVITESSSNQHLDVAGRASANSFSPVSLSSATTNSFYASKQQQQQQHHQFALASATNNSKTFPVLSNHLSNTSYNATSSGQLQMQHCSSSPTAKSLTATGSIYNGLSPTASPLNYQSTHFYQPTNLAIHQVQSHQHHHYQSGASPMDQHHVELASISSNSAYTHSDTSYQPANFYNQPTRELSATNHAVQKHSLHADGAASYSLHSLEAR